MDIITAHKVNLIEWLREEELFLQYVQSRKLINSTEYTKINSISDPSERLIALLDKILYKGHETCIAFLNLLKEDGVNESRPELKKWITSVNTSALEDKNKTTIPSQVANVKIADNLEFLKKNRSQLIGKVKNVDGIVDELSFTGEMVANVGAEKTDQAKMRKVLEYTNSKRAAQLLIDALHMHAGDVMEDLTPP